MRVMLCDVSASGYGGSPSVGAVLGVLPTFKNGGSLSQEAEKNVMCYYNP